MFKLTRLSVNGLQPLMALNCRSINMTFVRNKRILDRRPIRVLTDSGKDYFKQHDYKEPISSADHTIDPKVLDRKDRKQYNKCFDEGVYEDYCRDMDFEDDFEDNRPLIRQPVVKTKNKMQSKADENHNNVKPKPKLNTEDLKYERNKTEKVLKPKVEGIPVYERLGDKNHEFVNLMADLKNRKKREKSNIMLLEGRRLIVDAIDAKCQVKTIYFTKEENLVGIPGLTDLVQNGTKLKKLLFRDMQLFGSLDSCPGVMAVCERPTKSLFELRQSSGQQILPLILICENIRDPGNLGTMVRCAAAVGAHKLILMKGCADVWESKVLRAGAGAHFRIEIAADVEWPLVFNHIPIDKPFDLFIADTKDNFENRTKSETWVVTKPIPEHTINTITKDVDHISGETFARDDSYDDSNPELKNYKNVAIASASYCDTKYNMDVERPTVLVIGGETHGLSNQSYKLAYDYIGRKVKIPLAVGVDSLNSAVAAAVIMYEMRRQFECRDNCFPQMIDLIV